MDTTETTRNAIAELFAEVRGARTGINDLFSAARCVIKSSDKIDNGFDAQVETAVQHINVQLRALDELFAHMASINEITV